MRICPRCRSIYSQQIERCPGDGERVAEEHTYPLVGQRLDRYQIVEALGEGAMGCVYRATHNVLPREYALKVLFKDLASNETLIERFRREAQAVSTMAHPNIVSVADFVTLPNGTTFIVMELVPGRTLERAIQADAPFTPLRAARITRQIAAGLGEAHRMGFVHRDVKPSNIMLSEAGDEEQVKILDFGVVGIGAGPMTSRLTAVGHIIGTPTYMAPEQVHDPSVGPSADLYALGVILFEMLAGEPPFQGVDRTQVFVKHISEPPPVLPDCDGLELLAYWLLEKPPAKRPKSAEAVIDAIDRLAIGEDDPDALDAGNAPTRRTQRPNLDKPRKPKVVFEANTVHPAILEQDTDSQISQHAVERALADTDPSGDQRKNAELAAKLGTMEDGKNEITEVRTASTDDFFPELSESGESKHEWPTWDPDGSFHSSLPGDTVEPVEPMPAVERHDTEQLMLEASTELGMESPSGPITAPRVQRPIAIDPADAPAPIPQRVFATQLVRSRTKAVSGLEDTVPPPAVQVSDQPTDLMLYEPELPLGDRTAPNVVDDGPTQVDFDVSIASLGASASPSLVSVAPAAPVERQDTTAISPASVREVVGAAIPVPENEFDGDRATNLDFVPLPEVGVLDTDTLDVTARANGAGKFGARSRKDTADARTEIKLTPTEEEEPIHDTAEQVLDPALLDRLAIAAAQAAAAASVKDDPDEDRPIVLGTPLMPIDIPRADRDFDRALNSLRASADGQGSTVEDFEAVHGPTKINPELERSISVPAPSATVQLSPSRSTPPPTASNLRKLTLTFVIGFLLCVIVAGGYFWLVRNRVVQPAPQTPPPAEARGPSEP